MPIDITADARNRFHAAAYQPAKRLELIDDLILDPSLRAIARAEIARLDEGQQRGSLMDRDHISRMTHQTLTQALARVDELLAADAPAVIEETG